MKIIPELVQKGNFFESLDPHNLYLVKFEINWFSEKSIRLIPAYVC